VFALLLTGSFAPWTLASLSDPCPDFDTAIKSLREKSFARRQRAFAGEMAVEPSILKVLFLTHCTRQKGLFAAADAVLLANRELAARQIPMQLQLLAAGNFVTPEEKLEFERRYEATAAARFINYVGFVSGRPKEELLRTADLFLFPTRYHGETQSICLIEAMAFGLPVVTTRWRCLPEMLPTDYPGLVDDQDPVQIAATLLRILAMESGLQLRRTFLDRFEVQAHLAALAAALRTVEAD
jgi:glycosyltransferase involved in cell wall biosynthesis